MDLEDDFDPIARYEDFFKEHSVDGRIKYREMIEQMPGQNERSLVINFDDLVYYDPGLRDWTLERPSGILAESLNSGYIGIEVSTGFILSEIRFTTKNLELQC